LAIEPVAGEQTGAVELAEQPARLGIARRPALAETAGHPAQSERHAMAPRHPDPPQQF